MEVDKGEDDWELIHRLNTMGTRDKEELQAQFQSIVGTQMSPGCSKFYLEMGNWYEKLPHSSCFSITVYALNYLNYSLCTCYLNSLSLIMYL